jgi:signal transduction histidine kinase
MESAAQMRRIIDTFLELRVPTAGAGANGRVDLNLLGHAVVRQHSHAAERKQITLTTDLTEPLPLARCDAALAYQAFTNLTSNALKFTPLDGSVVLRTRAVGDRVRVEVHDTGPGVPPEEREQLFREHVRLSPRPTGGEESNGLGLAIVKHLIESQSGVVGAEFPAERGSVFWFELPAR